MYERYVKTVYISNKYDVIRKYVALYMYIKLLFWNGLYS